MYIPTLKPHKPYRVAVAKKYGGYFQSWDAYPGFEDKEECRAYATHVRNHSHTHKDMTIATVYVCPHGRIDWNRSDMLPRHNVIGKCDECKF